MKLSLVSLAVSSALLVGPKAAAQPNDCVVHEDHHYCLQQGAYTWQQAFDAAIALPDFQCPDDGRFVPGQLATFEGAAGAWANSENGPIFDLIGTSATWIGGNQDPDGAEPNTGWRWVRRDGSMVPIPTPGGDWRPGQPNQKGGDEGDDQDCLAFAPNRDYGWNDAFCTRERIYLVEYDCSKTCETCGDPHFKTWAGTWYDYHGKCDLKFLQSAAFGGGLGLDIDIRTESRYQYSYIESAAVKIGNDVLEVGSFGNWAINGVHTPSIGGHGGILNGYPIVITEVKKKRHTFVIQVGNEEKIVLTTFKDLVSVHVEGATTANFGDSVGLMGTFTNGTMLARDGRTVMAEDINAFGQEWQVRSSDPQLFQAVRAPQHPQQTCIVPEPTQISRRLGGSIAQEAAEKACAHLDDAEMQDMCVFDVLVMGDLEVAEVHGAY